MVKHDDVDYLDKRLLTMYLIEVGGHGVYSEDRCYVDHVTIKCSNVSLNGMRKVLRKTHVNRLLSYLSWLPFLSCEGHVVTSTSHRFSLLVNPEYIHQSILAE